MNPVITISLTDHSTGQLQSVQTQFAYSQLNTGKGRSLADVSIAQLMERLRSQQSTEPQAVRCSDGVLRVRKR
jgi:alpha-D-ribose 1-methylphosphonate 5-triphosphate diphosphatase PhnM